MDKITKHIVAELTGYKRETVDVSRGDRRSRQIRLRLLENGIPWSAPEGARVVVSYQLPDGTPGSYDTMPDGSPAGSVERNVVTAQLADQLTTQAGAADVSVVLLGAEGQQLAMWPVRLRVVGPEKITIPENLPALGAGYEERLLFGGEGGVLQPLAIGTGLYIEDDTLHAKGGSGGSSGPAYVASEEPPEDTDALWIDTTPPEEAVALGVTAAETAEGVDLYCTDELGTKTVSLRHGKDGAQGPAGPQGAPGADYELTDEDKEEIAGIAAGMVPGGGGVAVSRARVGQTIRVAAVDDSGKPTDWEAVEFPSIPFANAKAVLRIDAQIAPLEDGSYPKIYFTEDIDGNPLKMRAFCIITDWESSVAYSRLHFAKVAENRFEYTTSVPQKWDAKRPIVFSTSAHGILRMDSLYSNSRDTPINIPGETNPCGTWAGVSEVTGLGLSYVKSITFFRVYELIDEEVS